MSTLSPTSLQGAQRTSIRADRPKTATPGKIKTTRILQERRSRDHVVLGTWASAARFDLQHVTQRSGTDRVNQIQPLCAIVMPPSGLYHTASVSTLGSVAASVTSKLPFLASFSSQVQLIWFLAGAQREPPGRNGDCLGLTCRRRVPTVIQFLSGFQNHSTT